MTFEGEGQREHRDHEAQHRDLRLDPVGDILPREVSGVAARVDRLTVHPEASVKERAQAHDAQGDDPDPAEDPRRGGHQRRWVRHPPIQRDPAKSPPGDRVTDLRTQALKPQLRRANPNPMKTATITYTDGRTLRVYLTNGVSGVVG